VAAHPHLGEIDEVADNTGPALPLGALGQADFRYGVRDFYLTNPIARASALMAELSANAQARGRSRLAAE